MTMTRYEIIQKIEELRTDLRTIAVMDEATVCKVFNVDNKEEAIQATTEELECYKSQLQELNAYENRIINYEKTADMPCLCW